MSNELTFEEVTQCILANGRNVTYMVQGEVGIGKTTVGKAVAKAVNYPFAYMDMANMSLGDMTLPVADRERKCAEYYPNEILQMHLGRPIVVMMDEWTKAGKEVKNMSLPLALERRLGSIKLHPESIVFATGNLSGDGVGDSIQAHQLDRFIAVKQRKPDATEWINNFAINAGVDPTIMAFVDQFPQVLQSYTDDANNENKYIFNPRKMQAGFVTPRSLVYASDIIKNKHLVSGNALHASLSGAIGAPAAADLLSFVNMSESLPPFEAVVVDPLNCAMPDKPINQLLLMFNLLMKCDKDNLGKVIQYMRRPGGMSNETQGIFCNKILSTQSKAAWAAQVPEMRDMAVQLHYIF